MFSKNLVSRLILLVSIGSVFAEETSSWEKVPTDSQYVIDIAQRGLRDYMTISYHGPKQMIITNITSARRNPKVGGFFVEAKFEESDCPRGTYTNNCKVLRGGVNSICKFQGVHNQEINTVTTTCSDDGRPVMPDWMQDNNRGFPRRADWMKQGHGFPKFPEWMTQRNSFPGQQMYQPSSNNMNLNSN